MNIEMNTIRLLGAAQMVVFVASLLSDQLLKSVVGFGSMSAILLIYNRPRVFKNRSERS